MRVSKMLVLSWLMAAFYCATSALAQQPLVPKTEKVLINDKETEKQLHETFQRLLTGAKLIGHFTITGKPMTDLREETYEIQKVEKVQDGDIWVITARIKYGDKDLTLPVPLQVKWAGTTPVLTLDNVTLPGMGTFGARVVLHKDKYAGTWQHDDVGGHLFGKIELAEPIESATPSE